MKEKNYHEDNKAIVFYKDWADCIRLLNDTQAGQLLRALFKFAQTGEDSPLDGITSMAYAMMKNTIERDGKKWEDKCRKNSENAAKRWADDASAG